MGININPVQPQTNNNDDRPAAQVWAKVGFESTDHVTGESTFVSLPNGLPIDTMKHRKLSGSNEEWNRMVQAKNALLDQLMAAAAQIPEILEVYLMTGDYDYLIKVAVADTRVFEKNSTEFQGSGTLARALR